MLNQGQPRSTTVKDYGHILPGWVYMYIILIFLELEEEF